MVKKKRWRGCEVKGAMAVVDRESRRSKEE